MKTLSPYHIESVVIYTTKTCPHCHRAKELLKSAGIPFVEIDLTDKPEERARLTSQTQRKQVPQIFVNGQFIGGDKELEELLRLR